MNSPYIQYTTRDGVVTEYVSEDNKRNVFF